jgi:hypothetical protein
VKQFFTVWFLVVLSMAQVGCITLNPVFEGVEHYDAGDSASDFSLDAIREQKLKAERFLQNDGWVIGAGSENECYAVTECSKKFLNNVEMKLVLSYSSRGISIVFNYKAVNTSTLGGTSYHRVAQYCKSISDELLSLTDRKR